MYVDEKYIIRIVQNVMSKMSRYSNDLNMSMFKNIIAHVALNL